MNQVTTACLMANGWSVDRRVDDKEIVENLTRHGWSSFISGVEFLASFNGLPEFAYEKHKHLGFSPDAFSFTFRYTTGIDWLEAADKLANVIHMQLLPIGHQDLFEMFIDEEQRIYSIDADLMCLRIGNSFEESLDNLFLGRFSTEFVI